jgi:multidrug resistance efflux pump
MIIHIDKQHLRVYCRKAKTWLWQPHRRPYSIVGGTVLFVVLLILTKPGGQARDVPDPSHLIETQIISPQPLATTLYLYGTTESPAKSTLVSTVNSSIAQTPVKEGAMIKEGDLLLLIDPIEPQFISQQRSADVQEIEGLIHTENSRHQANLKALEHEQALLDLQNRALDRQQQLFKQKLTSQASVDQAKHEALKLALTVNARELEVADHESRLAQLEAKLSKARAQHALAELDLSRTRLVSPFQGRVAQLHVAPMDRVSPGTPLMDIYEHESLEIRTQIPTKYLSRLQEQLKLGEPVLAQAKIDGQTVAAQLERLSGDVKLGQGGVDALFKITDSHPNLALGRPVDLLISLNNPKPVVAIPYTALYGHDRIFKIVDNHLEGITIERFGERINAQGETELLISSEALADNDIILTSLLPNATTGMKVHAD